jgi:hypothetical protein
MTIDKLVRGNSRLEYMLKYSDIDLNFLDEFETFLMELPEVFRKIKGTRMAPMFNSLELLDKITRIRCIYNL